MLGYVAYFLICAFGFLQLFNMVRGSNRDLGRLPLVSLVAGLALLEYQVIRDGAPTYIYWGNAASLIATVLNLAYTEIYAAIEQPCLTLNEEIEARVGAAIAELNSPRYGLTQKGRDAVNHLDTKLSECPAPRRLGWR